jgi:hypothetical protein
MIFESWLPMDSEICRKGNCSAKARELSDISKQGIVSMFRPARFRADLATEGNTVVVSFAHENGLESHFGLEPTLAEALAHQILDASARGKAAKPQSVN